MGGQGAPYPSGDDVAASRVVPVMARLVAVFGVAAEVGVVGVVEVRLALMEEHVDGDGRTEHQATQGPGQVVGELQGVAVVGGEEPARQSGMLLADAGDLDPGVVEDGEVPTAPVAADLGDGVTAGVVEAKTRPHEGTILHDAAVGLAVRAGHVDVGTASVPGLVQGEQRIAVGSVDGEPVRGVGSLPTGPGDHVLVHVRQGVTGLAEDLVVTFMGVQLVGLFDQEYGGGEQGCLHGGLSSVAVHTGRRSQRVQAGRDSGESDGEPIARLRRAWPLPGSGRVWRGGRLRWGLRRQT